MEKIQLFLEKVGTFLADRRLWAVGLLMLFLQLAGYLGALDPQTTQIITKSFGESYVALQGVIVALVVLVKALGPLVAVALSVWKLIGSWTERPPSGLNFKALASNPK